MSENLPSRPSELFKRESLVSTNWVRKELDKWYDRVFKQSTADSLLKEYHKLEGHQEINEWNERVLEYLHSLEKENV